MSSALMHLTGMVEVTVRNAMDLSLTATHNARHLPGEWWDSGLDARGRKDVADARRRAEPKTNHGRVVAELNFGFWRYLVFRRYLTQFWIPAIQHAFNTPGVDPANQQRAWVEQRMRNLHFVRNRAAHHEPIFRRDLERDLIHAYVLADSIHVDVGHWIRRENWVESVLDSRPTVRSPSER